MEHNSLDESVPIVSHGAEHLSLHAEPLELDDLHQFDDATEYVQHEGHDIGDVDSLSEGDYVGANSVESTASGEPLQENKIVALDAEEDNGDWKSKEDNQKGVIDDLDFDDSDGEYSPFISGDSLSEMDKVYSIQNGPKPAPKKPPTEQMLNDFGLIEKKKNKTRKKKSKAVLLPFHTNDRLEEQKRERRMELLALKNFMPSLLCVLTNGKRKRKCTMSD